MATIKCILYRISTDSIIDFDFSVESEVLPLTGYDPDLKVYAYNTPYPEPDYDSRGYTLITTGTRFEAPHPTWPDLLEYRITFDTLRKLNPELNLAVDNMEEWANSQLAPDISFGVKRQKYNRILHKKVKGLTLTQDEDALLNQMDTIADAMNDNADNANLMKDYIENNPTLIPDFDAGWTTQIV